MLKDLQKGIDSTVWLHYEKRKMKECVNTLHNLASAFLTEENQEEEKDAVEDIATSEMDGEENADAPRKRTRRGEGDGERRPRKSTIKKN